MLNPGRFGRDHPGRLRDLRAALGNVGHGWRAIYGSIARLIRPGHPHHRAELFRPLRVAVPSGMVDRRGLAAPISALAARGPAIRRDLALALGACGVAAYNWWILVPLRPGLLRSPDELFSNLEISGQPFATLMQRADLLSGLAMLVAFMVAGTANVRSGRRDWLCMMVFSLACVVGGLFPETCADGISKSCRAMELGLQLPATQYLHIGAGVVEFGAITAALLFAAGRTWQQRTAFATVYHRLALAAIGAYPLLGLAYLTSRLGAIVEALFFIGFSVIVVVELVERTRTAGPDRGSA